MDQFLNVTALEKTIVPSFVFNSLTVKQLTPTANCHSTQWSTGVYLSQTTTDKESQGASSFSNIRNVLG